MSDQEDEREEREEEEEKPAVEMAKVMGRLAQALEGVRREVCRLQCLVKVNFDHLAKQIVPAGAGIRSNARVIMKNKQKIVIPKPIITIPVTPVPAVLLQDTDRPVEVPKVMNIHDSQSGLRSVSENDE